MEHGETHLRIDHVVLVRSSKMFVLIPPNCSNCQDLLICLEIPDCPEGYVNCQGQSPTRQCIRKNWICDGDNDCGNGWDEQRESCGQLSKSYGTI